MLAVDHSLLNTTYPSASTRTIFFPSTLPKSLQPSPFFSHFNAPARALPELPPTRRASVLISLRAAGKASSSPIFTQMSTQSVVRSKTSGIKSYLSDNGSTTNRPHFKLHTQCPLLGIFHYFQVPARSASQDKQECSLSVVNISS